MWNKVVSIDIDNDSSPTLCDSITDNIDGSVQDYSISSVLAMKILAISRRYNTVSWNQRRGIWLQFALCIFIVKKETADYYWRS